MRKLGADVVSIATNIAGHLRRKTKAELVAMLLNAYFNRVRDVMSEELVKNPHGKCIRVGSVSLVYLDGALRMRLGQVQEDYKNLIKNALPSIAGRIVGFLDVEKLE